ncbi:MAG: hypothetical protein WBQ73_01465 [Candidatus Babeliales bacterium]
MYTFNKKNLLFLFAIMYIWGAVLSVHGAFPKTIGHVFRTVGSQYRLLKGTRWSYPSGALTRWGGMSPIVGGVVGGAVGGTWFWKYYGAEKSRKKVLQEKWNRAFVDKLEKEGFLLKIVALDTVVKSAYKKYYQNPLGIKRITFRIKGLFDKKYTSILSSPNNYSDKKVIQATIGLLRKHLNVVCSMTGHVASIDNSHSEELLDYWERQSYNFDRKLVLDNPERKFFIGGFEDVIQHITKVVEPYNDVQPLWRKLEQLEQLVTQEAERITQEAKTYVVSNIQQLWSNVERGAKHVTQKAERITQEVKTYVVSAAQQQGRKKLDENEKQELADTMLRVLEELP